MSPHLSCRAYKTIDDEDLKFPLIYGEGKKVRLGALNACVHAHTDAHTQSLKNTTYFQERHVRVCVWQARVLATIGVTRGLGDHDLKVHDSNIYIKPFLSCCPEVRAVKY